MAKKKTREEYVKQLKIKNPDVELIGDYINDNTKTLHRCNKHDVLWDISPNKALQGRGCQKCGKEKYRNKRAKPEDQYIKELAIKNPTIKLRGKYINNNVAVEHYCETHDVIFDARPNDALRGSGCKYCKADKLKNIFLKTKEEYVAELKDKNPNLRLLGDYFGCETPTSHCCDKHNVVWDISPHNALQGKGCYRCSSEKIRGKLRKSDEQYIEELSIKNPNLIFVGLYINYNTPTKHYCQKHKIYFDISPNCALLGYGCSQCTSEKRRESRLKPEEQYVNELKEAHPNIMLRGKYVGVNVNTPHECLICGCEWSPRPSNLLTGYGCPGCNESKGEKQVETWLKHNKIMYVPQNKFDDCFDKRLLPFDFYLPNYNICIEYQGKQHYEAIDYFGGVESLLYTQRHDKIKSDYCMKQNIKLICIPYWEDIDEYLDQNLLI